MGRCWRRCYNVSVALQTKLYTIEDLRDLDGEYELDRGVLVPIVPAFREHGRVCGEAHYRITAYVRKHRLGEVYINDTGFVLERGPDTLRGPDVAFVRRERLADLPGAEFVEGAPDLAVEVVSSGGNVPNAIRKAAQYIEAGCALVWIVDIGHRRALVFQSDGIVQTLNEDAALDGLDILPGFHVTVRDLL